MVHKFKKQIHVDESMVYQIRIKGHLDSQWVGWFDGLVIEPQENGDTLVTGPVVDQAALYGLLRKIRDIGLPLLLVSCVQPGTSDKSPVNS